MTDSDPKSSLERLRDMIGESSGEHEGVPNHDQPVATAEKPADGGEGDGASDKGRPRRRAGGSTRNRDMIVTVVVIVLVLALSGVLIALATGSDDGGTSTSSQSATTNSVPERGPNTVAYDRFDRINQQGSLGKAETGQTWQTGQSVWSISDGSARMEPSDPADGALAVVPLGSVDGTIEVTLTKIANGAGIVFRYQNPFNYWQVTASPKFATWNVRKVVDGQVITVGTTGVSSAGDGTTISARFVGDAITVQVNGKDAFAVNDAALDGAGFVGLVGTADTEAAPRWDNFAGDSVVRPVTTTAATAPPESESSSSSSRPN